MCFLVVYFYKILDILNLYIGYGVIYINVKIIQTLTKNSIYTNIYDIVNQSYENK